MPTESLTSAVFGSFSIARCIAEAASAAASGVAASTITLSAVLFIRRAPHEAAACPRRNWQRSSASCAALSPAFSRRSPAPMMAANSTVVSRLGSMPVQR